MPALHAIVCALDFSPASRTALLRAADLAERARAALHLVHVNPLFRARMAHSAQGDPQSAFRDHVHAFVDDVLGAVDAFDVLVPIVHQSTGAAPADGILAYAIDVEADLVVVGTHGRRGLGGLLQGSVAADTLRRSAVPVLVVPERSEAEPPGPDAPVLLGVDFSDHTAPALAWAQGLADVHGAPLAVAHVRDVPPDTLIDVHARRPLAPPTGLASREGAHDALEAILAGTGLDAHSVGSHVVPGQPATVLSDLSRKLRAGLLVVGTHGRRGWDRVRLGSVAEEVIRRATGPVLVVPAPAVGAVSAASPAGSSAGR